MAANIGTIVKEGRGSLKKNKLPYFGTQNYLQIIFHQ
jgi:hypothetical protein